MTRDIDPITAFGMAMNQFGVSAAEAAEAMKKLGEAMAELTPCYYKLGYVPRLEITTRENQKVVLENVELDVEVEIETVEHRSFGGPTTEVVIGSKVKGTIKTNAEIGESLYRLLRED